MVKLNKTPRALASFGGLITSIAFLERRTMTDSEGGFLPGKEILLPDLDK